MYLWERRLRHYNDFKGIAVAVALENMIGSLIFKPFDPSLTPDIHPSQA